MRHVSDPCASSPQPLDQTIIRWMVEMEWSCASLHAFSILSKLSSSGRILREHPCNRCCEAVGTNRLMFGPIGASGGLTTP